MFRVMLFTQWKWSRLIILLGTIAAFTLPVISLQGAAHADRSPLEAQDTRVPCCLLLPPTALIFSGPPEKMWQN